MKKKKPMSEAAVFNIIGIGFTVFGLIFMIIGIVTCVESRMFMKNAVQTEAEITSIESHTYRRSGKTCTDHDVWIRYTVDGATYESELNEYNSGMHEGGEIEVYYDPDDPSDVRTDSKLLYIIFSGIGGVFAVIGIVFIVVNIRSAARRKALVQNGDRLSGTIINVRQNMNVAINRRHPYKAECEVINPFDGEKYLYSSGNITEDITELTGMEVTVYVDRNDKSKYYVDVYELIERQRAEKKIYDYR